MKIFISADIEGVNGIVNWRETEPDYPEYDYFKRQMTEEVKRACIGAKKAGATEILVKDAHDTARNIIPSELPEYVKIHRGWQGAPCSMMAGLDSSYDAVMFIGYHSASRSSGNSLSHTMNVSRLFHVKINGKIASEFYINALYAAYLNVPVAFLSGDDQLTKNVKEENENIVTVSTKEGVYGASISRHPNITNKEIEDNVYTALTKDLKNNKLILPRHFDIEIQYKNHIDAYNASFYPDCKLLGSDKVLFSSDDYYEVLRMFKFCL